MILEILDAHEVLRARHLGVAWHINWREHTPESRRLRGVNKFFGDKIFFEKTLICPNSLSQLFCS